MPFRLGALQDPAFYFHSITANIICSIVFGKRFGYRDPEFLRLLDLFFQSFVLISSLSSQVQEGRSRVYLQAGERGVLLLGTRKAASSQKRGKDNRDRERDRDTEAWGKGEMVRQGLRQ